MPTSPRWNIDTDAFKRYRRVEWNDIADYLPEASSTTVFTVTATAAGRLLDAVGAGPGTRLLDVACGPGHWVAATLARGVDLTGIDLSENMVAESRRKHPGVDFRVGDAERLAFDDASFDAVTTNFGVQVFAQPEMAMLEALRVLRPGGRYAFTTWCPPEENDFYRLVRSALDAHGAAEVALPQGPPRFLYSSPAECEQILTELGFCEVRAERLPLVAELTDPAMVLDILNTIGRTRAIVEGQPPEARDRIRRAIVEGARRYARDGVVYLPMQTVLASGGRAA